MTPDQIDRAIVGRRLRLMQEALETLAQLPVSSGKDRDRDPVAEAAVERLMQVLVDLALDINGHLVVALLRRAPETGRQSFLDMAAAKVISDELADRLAPAASLRNVLVHHYVDIDRGLVADAVPALLRDVPEYTAAVARFVNEIRR